MSQDVGTNEIALDNVRRRGVTQDYYAVPLILTDEVSGQRMRSADGVARCTINYDTATPIWQPDP